MLEKSRDDDEKEEEQDMYPEESTDYDDENANPFKTMLQKGMKKPAFISRDEGDEEYVNYDNTVDEMEEEMETNNKGFSSAAENLIPKFSVPKFKIPEKKAATQTPSVRRRRRKGGRIDGNLEPVRENAEKVQVGANDESCARRTRF